MEISTKHHTKIYLIRNMVENSMFHLLQDDYIPMQEISRKKKTNSGESKRRRYTYTERERARGREGETCFNIL